MITTTKKNTVTKPNGELIIEYIINAPREKVFMAWIDPKQLAKWWGPELFTNPVCELDVRPGGAIRVTMRGPDGQDYPMGGVFQEIVKPERLVFTTTAFVDKKGNAELENLNSVTFENLPGEKTKLTLRAVIRKSTPAMIAGPLKGMEAGWTGSFVKLSKMFA